MIKGSNIPAPFQFNPLKHHLLFIRQFISNKLTGQNQVETGSLVKELKHIGTSVMDVYSGSLSIENILSEIKQYLVSNNLLEYSAFSGWAGKRYSNFRVISLSDSSCWMLKFHDDSSSYVHIFPARMSPHSFRIKANTLKSAVLYYIIIGKDYISAEDLNRARNLLGLSPVKDPDETEAITEMIEILRM